MRRRREIILDLTALIDVVFILLIFFILTATFKKDEHRLTITIPATEHGEKIKSTKEIIIELSEIEIAYNGKCIKLAEVDKELARIKDNEIPVFFHIDRQVKYEKIVDILDLLKKYRIENIILVTQAA